MREFSGSKLRELTVHHKDYNHDSNPPDGSNGELLCLHCHEYEHAEQASTPWFEGGGPTRPGTKPDTTHQPFAGLTDLFKAKSSPDEEGEYPRLLIIDEARHYGDDHALQPSWP